jgi:hypothetical protein
MINKLHLQATINKYYLGENESVKWDIKDKTLTINFTSINREVIGKIVCSNAGIEDCELSIFDTKKLISLLNITQGELLLNIEKHKNIPTKLHIQDSKFDLTYALADPLLIPRVGTVNEPEWEADFPLDSEDLLNLVKAKTALGDIDNMMVSTEIDLNGDKMCTFTFGDEHGHNNKVTYHLYGNIKVDDIKLPFNSNQFKNILNTNKDLKTGKLYLNSQGLMKLEFDTGDIQSTYYMVRKEDRSF